MSVAALRPSTLRTIALVAGGSLLFVMGARISIDIGPVPLTFQPLAVALVAALLGPRLGAAAAIAYLAEGASGLPVFAGGSGGVMWLAGATAGYLWSYPLATYTVAALLRAPWSRSYAGRYAANLAGLAIIYTCGAAWLSMTVGPAAALALGVAPFIVADLVKLGLAAMLRPSAR